MMFANQRTVEIIVAITASIPADTVIDDKNSYLELDIQACKLFEHIGKPIKAKFEQHETLQITSID